ncbi:hypothetical protein PR048_025611 [Dryococelus australis]|uniref:Uncharacterized protein n=1 Tax=Dryococelus australis TaxID=614101 RepID=A0ABQ9GRU4_9NEOP|nr:hypothetical protein PR048_025611 [Dryococelus australis]
MEYLDVVQGIHPWQYGFVEGKSMEKVVSEGGEGPEKDNKWAENFKLEFSVDKMSSILVKGNPKRAPIVRLNGRVVKLVHEMTYLGVMLEILLSFHSHVRYTANKSVVMFQKLGAVASVN